MELLCFVARRISVKMCSLKEFIALIELVKERTWDGSKEADKKMLKDLDRKW